MERCDPHYLQTATRPTLLHDVGLLRFGHLLPDIIGSVPEWATRASDGDSAHGGKQINRAEVALERVGCCLNRLIRVY